MPVGSAAQTSGRPRRARGDLSREQIVEAALAFLDRRDAGELTMRRLAAELNAGTMTLYGYFRDKDELMDAVVEAIADRRTMPELTGTWREQLKRLFLFFEQGLSEHPALVRMRLERPLVTPRSLRLTEAGMQILLGAGFERQEAAIAFRTLFTYTFGSAAFNPREQVAESMRQFRAAAAALPRDRYPALTEAPEELEQVMDPSVQFERGLELLLDGLEARLAR